MRAKRFFFGLLVLTLLSCNFVTQMVFPPTATPIPPTFTPTATVTASPTPTLTPTPLVPAYIPPQCDASAPLATIQPDTVIQPTPQFETKQISKRLQLRIVDEVEQIVERVYVYPDYNGKDWEGIVARYRDMVNNGLETEAFYREMQNMIDELEDEHSSFGNCSHSKIWLKQERQDWRTHQLYQFLKGVLAVAFCSVKNSG